MKHYLKKAIRLSNHLSPGDTVCRSAQLSWRCRFYVIALLSLLPPGHPTCTNEWQSAAAALIYCMAARTEPVCQRCITALRHTNTCDAEPVRQEWVPARCSLPFRGGGGQRSSGPHQLSQLHRHHVPVGLLVRRQTTRRERPLRFILHSFVFC